MKIHITGNAGSGKTTLAATIGGELGLPVYGLDSIVWSSGWKKTPPAVRATKEVDLILGDDWVIDGVSPVVRKAADVTILLDVDRLTAFRRCAARNWRYLFRSRPGLPDKCPEILIIPKLCQIIWRFPERVLPQIVADLESSKGKYFHVKNEQALDGALAYLGMANNPQSQHKRH